MNPPARRNNNPGPNQNPNQSPSNAHNVQPMQEQSPYLAPWECFLLQRANAQTLQRYAPRIMAHYAADLEDTGRGWTYPAVLQQGMVRGEEVMLREMAAFSFQVYMMVFGPFLTLVVAQHCIAMDWTLP